MTISAGTTSDKTVHASWAGLLATLIALGAFWFNSHYPIIALVAALVTASYGLRWRVPNYFTLIWPMRAALFSLALLTMPGRLEEPRTFIFLDPTYVNLFGALCAAELVVQCWKQRTHNPPHGEMMVLSSFILAMATNTTDTTLIAFVGPAYVVALAWSLGDFKPVRASADDRKRQFRRIFMRVAALSLAAVIGWGVSSAMYRVRRIGSMPLARILERFIPSPETGQPTSPVLGQRFNLSPSPTRVLRIDGLPGDGHLRGIAFDSYQDGRWNPPLSRRQFETLGASTLQPDAVGKRFRVTRLMADFDLLYVPLNCAGIALPSQSLIERDSGTGHTIRAVGTDSSLFAYEVAIPAAHSSTYQGPLCETMTDLERQRYLAVSAEIDSRVRELAMEIAGGEDPLKQILSIQTYFRTHNAYSLKIEPGEGDPISDFILNRRAAHCQYFASAAVMLMRCVGIPSRYVSGYYAHERDGNIVTVRQRDAHAWAEAWIDGVGWITVDATPVAGRPDATAAAVSRVRRIWETAQDHFRELRQWLGALPWRRIGLIGGPALIVLMPLQWWWQNRRKRIKRKATTEYACPNEELRKIAIDFERVLQKHDVPCDAGNTWSEHLTRLRENRLHPIQLDVSQAIQFVAEYNQARFSDAQDDQHIERLKKRFKKWTGEPGTDELDRESDRNV